MGLIALWQQDVILNLKALQPQLQIINTDCYVVLDMQNGFLIHLIPLINNFKPSDLIALQNKYKQENKQLIHLWEDIWLTKTKQVLFRIGSFLGQNIGFHGRKTKIAQLNKNQTVEFLNHYHLQGYVNAKFSFGLIANDEIIAVASFAEPRLMKLKANQHQSAELVRFASKSGITVVGGLSKLIKHFIKQVNTNDVMTYADRDWSLGKGYDKLGFQLTQETEPLIFYVDKADLKRYLPHRLPKKILLGFKAQNILSLDDFLTSQGFIKVFNTGNLKYHLYL